ncbi:MAG TPA: hypothetical protein VNQ99_06955 [Xanthobacteraceae bacterium]|nr:hypothetical protein [Xanthobacteraceae bacterium]
MEVRIEFQEVSLFHSSKEMAARLVFLNGDLVAIFSLLDDDHGALSNRWFPEAVLGQFDRQTNLSEHTFHTLDDVREWVVDAAYTLSEELDVADSAVPGA